MHVVYPKPLKLLSLSARQVVLLQYYLDTSYVLNSSSLGPSITIRVGEPCRELNATYEEVLGKGLLFVTAWNPASTPLSKSENATRHQSLLNDLAGYFFVAGVGRSNDGEWHEESLGVFNIGQADAMSIGDRYGQNAVVWVGPEAEPVILLCSTFFIE